MAVAFQPKKQPLPIEPTPIPPIKRKKSRVGRKKKVKKAVPQNLKAANIVKLVELPNQEKNLEWLSLFSQKNNACAPCL